MNDKIDNPAAFPIAEQAARIESYQGLQHHYPHVPAQSGMTLRDYFAGQALMALISKDNKDGEKCGKKAVPLLAQYSYEYADAMLKARNQQCN